MTGAGLTLTNLSNSNTFFNWDSGSFAANTGWVGAGAGFLAIDDGSGQITAADLLGSSTQDGFAALRALDSNGDGVIDASDAGFAKLVVWQDVNGDGTVEAGEVSTLAQLGIVSISLSTTASGSTVGGNVVNETAIVTMTDGTTREIADVTFSVSDTYTQYVGPATISAEAAVLPQLHGYGDLMDLRRAMSGDPQLMTLVQNLSSVSTSDTTAFDSAVQSILLEWAGVTNVDSASRGREFDAKRLEFLEQYLGTPFVTYGGSNTWASPQSGMLSNAFDAAFDGLKARLLVQDASSAFSTIFSYDSTTDRIQMVSDFGTTLTSLALAAPTEAAASRSYWIDALLVISDYISGLSADSSDATDFSIALPIIAPTIFSAAVLSAAANGALNVIDTSTLNTPTTSSNQIFGTSSADIFDVKSPNIYIQGGGGGDEFFIDPGLGRIEIYEEDKGENPANTLQFGAGIGVSDLKVTSDGYGDLILTFDSSGDSVVLDDEFGHLGYGVQTVAFDDGTTLSRQDLLAMEMAGTPAADTLYGTSGADVLDGKGGGDHITGGGGGDTFIFNQGYGRLEIYEEDDGAAPANILQFGPGISISDLTVTSNGYDLILKIGSNGDCVVLDDELSRSNYGVQTITFADGTTLSRQDLLAMEMAGTPGADTLYGTSSAEVLDGKGGGDHVTGGGGGDTFVFNQGYGRLEIYEEDEGVNPANTLQFGPGISISDLTVTSNGYDLILTVGSNGDCVVLDDELSRSSYGVQTITFADGTTLSRQDLLAMEMTGTPGADTLYGTSGADVIDGKGGIDHVAGGGGNDTFVYNQGYGALEIYEYDNSIQPYNVLQLGAGITQASLTVTADRYGNIFIADGVSGDRIEIDYEITGGVWGVQAVQLSDGTTLTSRQLIAMEMTGTTGSNTIYGTNGADVIDGKGGGDYIIGNGGGDTFIYNLGYGRLEINEEDSVSNPANILQFGAGINVSNLKVTSDNYGNMILTIGSSGDVVVLDGMFNSPNYGVQTLQFSDGTILTRQDLLAMEISQGAFIDGTSGSDSLIGNANANIMDGKGGDDYLRGNGGGDTFIYNQGYGSLEIYEYDSASTPYNVLQLGSGITLASLTVTADRSGDIFITDGVSGDQIEIDGEMLNGNASGVQAIEFADGATLTRDQLIAMEMAGTSRANSIVGTADADVIDGRGGGDYVRGNGGGDTFIYNQGYGSLEIYEYDSASTPYNVLQLGAGITLASLTVTADRSGDIFITDGVSGDQIEIDGEMLNGNASGVQAIEFADGATLTRDQLIAMEMTGASGANLIVGTADADVLDGKGGGDYIRGNGGGDTFIYNQGYGSLEIYEYEDSSTPYNVLRLGAGITLSSLTVTADRYGDIFIADGVSGDQIEIDYEITGGGWGVQAVQLSDGTTLTSQQLIALEMTGTSGSNSIYGAGGADVIDGKGGGDYINGGGGGDTFVYNQGYGALEIYEYDSNNGANNIIQFGAGVSASEVAVSKDRGGDIILTIGGGSDVITLDNAYNDQNYGVQSVHFSDGTAWTRQDLISFIDGKTSTTGPSLSKGSGQLAYDISGSSGHLTLQLGAGIIASDVILEADSNNTLTVLLKDTGDSITFHNDLSWSGGIQSLVQTLQFADGTTETIGSGSGQLGIFTWIGTATNTTLVGTSYGPNVFDLGPGGDTITAGAYAGTNTFDFDKGDGQATVYMNGAVGTLVMASDISASDVILEADNNNTLTVLLKDTGDSITFHNDLSWSGGIQSLIQTLQFADGTTETIGSAAGQLGTFTWIGSPSNTNLVGSGWGANVFQIGAGVESVNGGSGNNTIEFGPVSGQATINLASNGGSTNELDFGSGITDENLWFAQNGNDLQIDVIGTDSQITFKNWYSGSPSNQAQEVTAGGLKIDSQVAQLVSAMATFSASNGSFNPVTATQMPADSGLQSAIAAAWHS